MCFLACFLALAFLAAAFSSAADSLPMPSELSGTVTRHFALRSFLSLTFTVPDFAVRTGGSSHVWSAEGWAV